MLVGLDQPVLSIITVPAVIMMPFASPPQWTSSARPPCTFPGVTGNLPTGFALHMPGILDFWDKSRAFSHMLLSPG
jgi:hypothetical protein